jgi:hypothetical protein
VREQVVRLGLSLPDTNGVVLACLDTHSPPSLLVLYA